VTFTQTSIEVLPMRVMCADIFTISPTFNGERNTTLSTDRVTTSLPAYLRAAMNAVLSIQESSVPPNIVL